MFLEVGFLVVTCVEVFDDVVDGVAVHCVMDSREGGLVDGGSGPVAFLLLAVVGEVGGFPLESVDDLLGRLCCFWHRCASLPSPVAWFALDSVALSASVACSCMCILADTLVTLMLGFPCPAILFFSLSVQLVASPIPRSMHLAIVLHRRVVSQLLAERFRVLLECRLSCVAVFILVIVVGGVVVGTSLYVPSYGFHECAGLVVPLGGYVGAGGFNH